MCLSNSNHLRPGHMRRVSSDVAMRIKHAIGNGWSAYLWQASERPKLFSQTRKQRPRTHISCVQVSSGWNLRSTYPRVLFFFFLLIGPSSVPPGLRIWGSNVEYDRMLGTFEWGVRPNARYDRKACTIEWHTAHERIACSTIQWDGGYDPIAFLTRMPLHKNVVFKFNLN